jgi:hypothetical protein
MKNAMFTALQKTRIAEQQFTEGVLHHALATNEITIGAFQPILDTQGVDVILLVVIPNRVIWVKVAVVTTRAVFDSQRYNSLRRVAQRHCGAPFFVVVRDPESSQFAVIPAMEVITFSGKSMRPSRFVPAIEAVRLIVDISRGSYEK